MLWKTGLLLAGVVLLLLLALVAIVRREQHVAQGGEIVWDDFGFADLEHRAESKLGDVLPRGVFHVVRLEVRNHAKRVNYRLDGHRAVLFDGQGREYEVSPEGQRALEAIPPEQSVKAEIAPGETFASDLAFDLPREAEDLRLRIAWGGRLVDAVDDILCGTRDIALR